jgi:hypothetical protein
MSKFLDLVKSVHPLSEADETPEEVKNEPVEVSDELETRLPKELDATVKVQLIKLAVATLFVDKDRLEESNPSARTIINQISSNTPIDISNVEETQKLLEELMALVSMPS